MKINYYTTFFSILLAGLGFALALPYLVIAGIGAIAASTLVVWGLTLKTYLQASFGGEKPPVEGSLTSLLAISMQSLALFALVARFSFMSINPEALRLAMYLALPTLIILLIQLWLSADMAAFAYHQKLLIRTLSIAAITFMFFLTPEKRLAKYFYSQQPEKLEKLLQAIEARKPQPNTLYKRANTPK